MTRTPAQWCAGKPEEPAMSTRALYTFKGESAADTWNVYKHHDGYPTGAATTLVDAITFYAWKLPRYEADEFAASFCAAGKSHYFLRALAAKTAKDRAGYLRFADSNGGGVRMMPQGEPLAVAVKHCGDIEYRYEIFTGNNNELRIRAYSVDAWDAPGAETLLTDCLLTEFSAWAEKEEKTSK
jgi:hypothetical protein